MHTLYDSDTFCVTHMLPAESETRHPSGAFRSEAGAQALPTLLRHGFEIIDKRSGKEVYLDGSWAELFQQHLQAWQANAPTQEEVEDTLERYAGLAQQPVMVH